MMNRRSGVPALLVVALFCAGCGGAPSIDVIGSYFPVWMLCLAIAVVLVFGLRYLLHRFRVEEDVGPVALFYPGAVVLFTSLLWLIFFR